MVSGESGHDPYPSKSRDHNYLEIAHLADFPDFLDLLCAFDIGFAFSSRDTASSKLIGWSVNRF